MTSGSRPEPVRMRWSHGGLTLAILRRASRPPSAPQRGPLEPRLPTPPARRRRRGRAREVAGRGELVAGGRAPAVRRPADGAGAPGARGGARPARRPRVLHREPPVEPYERLRA